MLRLGAHHRSSTNRDVWSAAAHVRRRQYDMRGAARGARHNQREPLRHERHVRSRACDGSGSGCHRRLRARHRRSRERHQMRVRRDGENGTRDARRGFCHRWTCLHDLGARACDQRCDQRHMRQREDDARPGKRDVRLDEHHVIAGARDVRGREHDGSTRTRRVSECQRHHTETMPASTSKAGHGPPRCACGVSRTGALQLINITRVRMIDMKPHTRKDGGAARDWSKFLLAEEPMFVHLDWASSSRNAFPIQEQMS